MQGLYQKIKVSSLSFKGEKSGRLRSIPLGWDGEVSRSYRAAPLYMSATAETPYPIDQEKKKISLLTESYLFQEEVIINY
ncbi:hypothetical protein AFK68_29805 [Hydrocoleum sp. CS-953]|uniref:hypothetical protein n=1 Tax=Hydrocoleum sp. CS-953 TaxID=1671698 RepID=UPI000B9B4B72|nr:hypothetical protein [Hydrocoleum sp. CS-953]OZH51607.1 hypothetical protein AFK68_29805 [Hydrocoleum sp. CS-953]